MDLRIRKTYKALREACTKLLSERRYEEMSVALLCQEAMIRLTTFYKHFSDKEDFFQFYIKSLRDEMVQEGRREVEERGEKDSFEAERAVILRRLADYLLSHQPLIDNIFRSSMSGMMLMVVCENIAQALKERMVIEREVDPSLDSRVEFAAGGMVRLMLMWWKTEERETSVASFVRCANDLAGKVLE